MIRISADLLGLTDATSNVGFSAGCAALCDWTAGAADRDGRRAPAARGATTTRIAAAARRIFFDRVSEPVAQVMIASIRFRRSDPVIPAAQASGGSTQKRHVLRMLSA
jgi:hypothetical protein